MSRQLLFLFLLLFSSSQTAEFLNTSRAIK